MGTSIISAALALLLVGPVTPGAVPLAGVRRAPSSPDSTPLARPPLPRRRVTLDLHHHSLREVLRYLSTSSGVNIVLRPGVEGHVTMYVNNVWLSEAFEAILRTQGLWYERIGSVVYVGHADQVRKKSSR